MTRRLLNLFRDHVQNGWAGRQLYGLAKRMGLVNIEVEVELGAWPSTNYAEVQQLRSMDCLIAQVL